MHIFIHIYKVTTYGSAGKESACNAEDTGNVGSVPSEEYPLEKEMATHSSSLAWEIP